MFAQQDKMTAQGMMLRNMALVGSTAPSIMPKEHRPAFEAGVKILFSKWTALQLGVMNEWGGPNSKEKAEGIMEEAVEWFYKRKDHEMQDLADLLDQCISEDFYIQAEDDSPYQVVSVPREEASLLVWLVFRGVWIARSSSSMVILY